jgi:hypothetical protein
MNTETSTLYFHEKYGFVSRHQLDIYQKFGITTSEHDLLVMQFGEVNHSKIIEYLITKNGKVNVTDWW